MCQARQGGDVRVFAIARSKSEHGNYPVPEPLAAATRVAYNTWLIQGERMKHILLTVGTNPIPVLVAARRLWESWGRGQSSLALLHSPETRDLADQLLTLMAKGMRLRERPPEWILVETPNAASPSSITKSVYKHFVVPHCQPGDTVHVHYTGGTKAMGVNAIRALLTSDRPLNVTDSYLDPRENQLVAGDGNLVDTTVLDERPRWQLSVEEVAALHGFTTEFREFGVAFGPGLDRDDSHHPNPSAAPNNLWVEASLRVSNTLGSPAPRNANAKSEGLLGEFVKKTRPWGGALDPGRRWPQLPALRKGPCWWTWPDLEGAGSEWRNIPQHLNQAWGEELWTLSPDGYTLDATRLAPDRLEHFLAWVSGGWLELMTWGVLRDVFREQDLNQFVPHDLSYRFSPIGAGGHFELDVLAIYGYQLLAISCSTVSSQDKVKQKGFEILHRARQIGGEGAHVAIVSLQSPASAERTEQDLQTDIGGQFPNRIRVLPGRDASQLKRLFHKHLRHLGWEA